MVDRGNGGAIVNISSFLSTTARALLTAYGASKAALDQVTRTMSLELGPHQVSEPAHDRAIRTQCSVFVYNLPS